MTSSITTSTGTFFQDPGENQFDYLFRITGDEISGAQVCGQWKTQDLSKAFYIAFAEKQFQINTLVSVVNWQHELLEYNGHYNAYLLEQLSENEFEGVAAKFAYEPVDIAAEKLVPKIRTILNLTKINYTLGDFESMFHCNRESVVSATEALGKELQQRITE